MEKGSRVGIRWTIGNVSQRGFEALRLSIWGAWKVFGPGAAYMVLVNGASVRQARRQTGHVPEAVEWQNHMHALPEFLKRRLDANMAEGVGWKLAPLRIFPDLFEISLDNDCILWEVPPTLGRWLDRGHPRECLLAEDVKACFGQFTEFCGPEPRNSGLRGLPPGFDLGAALESVLREKERLARGPLLLRSETDEQGLQTAALTGGNQTPVVTLNEVAICSPFYPHRPGLGTCGAHFVGLNARHLPWDYFDRPADEWEQEHWERHFPALCALVNLPNAEMSAATQIQV